MATQRALPGERALWALLLSVTLAVAVLASYVVVALAVLMLEEPTPSDAYPP